MVEHDHTTMLYIMFIPLYRTVAVFTKTSPVRSVWSMSRYGTKPSVVHIVFHADMIRHILFMYFFTELFISLCTFLQKYFSVLFIILKDTFSIINLPIPNGQHNIVDGCFLKDLVYL